MDPDIDFRITNSDFDGTDEYISLRSKDPRMVWSVDGFIQHSFRGQPTHRTGLSGAVSLGIAPRHFVGGHDRQWSVTFTRKQNLVIDDNIFGGRNRSEVSIEIEPFEIPNGGTFFRYVGRKIVFIYGKFPSGGFIASSAVGPDQVLGGLPNSNVSTFDLRFAEYCA